MDPNYIALLLTIAFALGWFCGDRTGRLSERRAAPNKSDSDYVVRHFHSPEKTHTWVERRD